MHFFFFFFFFNSAFILYGGEPYGGVLTILFFYLYKAFFEGGWCRYNSLWLPKELEARSL